MLVREIFAPSANGVDGHIARAAEFAGNRGDVKRLRRFVLQFDVLDARMVARENFRHRVCEIRDVAGAEVAFHDRQLAVRLGDDEVARQDGFAVLLRGRNVNQLHRLGDFHARRHEDKRAVGEKRLIQRGKSVVRRVRVFAEVLFDERGIFCQRGGKVFNPHAAGHRLDAGKFRGEKPVHEHEPVAGQFGEGGFVQQFRFRAVDHGFARERERQLRDGRDVGEPPVLVAQFWKAEIGKTRDAGFAQGGS